MKSSFLIMDFMAWVLLAIASSTAFGQNQVLLTEKYGHGAEDLLKQT